MDLYNAKTEIIKRERSKIESINSDLSKLQITKNLAITYPETGSFLLAETTIELDNLIANKRKQYQDDWSNGIGLVITKLNELKLHAEGVVSQAEKEISIAKEKVESQKTLKGRIEALVTEEKKVEEIATLQLEKDRSFSNVKECTAKLSSKNAEYYSIYLEAKSHVNLDGLDEELTFSIDTVFSDKRFGENFVDKFFDGRSLRSGQYDFFTKYNFDSKQKHEEFIKDLIWKVLTQKDFPFNKNVEKREVITALSKNWFLHDYKVGYQGDELIDMSPGKKSFVLLRLLIDLDNSECPILVDQPEDDLDNRSIYDDIVAFLNRRKKKRQIIIVTHNPNLVLGSDAELVIVANQDGEDTRNKNSKFEYVSGAIEHSIDENDTINEVLLRRGIQEHICSILEGGEEAFNKRRNKYRFSR